MGSLQERAVASHRDDEVGIEVAPFEDARSHHFIVLSLREELEEFLLDVYFSLVLREKRENLLNGNRLLGLIDIAKKGKAEFALCHNTSLLITFWMQRYRNK